MSCCVVYLDNGLKGGRIGIILAQMFDNNFMMEVLSIGIEHLTVVSCFGKKIKNDGKRSGKLFEMCLNDEKFGKIVQIVRKLRGGKIELHWALRGEKKNYIGAGDS